MFMLLSYAVSQFELACCFIKDDRLVYYLIIVVVVHVTVYLIFVDCPVVV